MKDMATALVDLTPNSLLELPPPENGKSYELSEGELIVVGTAGIKHERIKHFILRVLFEWEIKYGAGEVYSETLFTLGKNTARIPDAAVLLTEKVALLPNTDVAAPVAPDLAVEVISQTELAYLAERKAREYIMAGVQEVWQIYPNEHLVRVRWADGICDFKRADILQSRVLKNFETAVNRFFVD